MFLANLLTTKVKSVEAKYLVEFSELTVLQSLQFRFGEMVD